MADIFSLSTDDRPSQEDPAFAPATFVSVILPVPVHREFSYRVSREWEKKVAPGMRVLVQFGKKKIYTGIIERVHHELPVGYQAKYVLDIYPEEERVTETQLKFWRWMSDYYCCPIGQVMDAAIPSYLRPRSETKITLATAEPAYTYELDEREKEVLEALKPHISLELSELSALTSSKGLLSIVRSLYEKGLLELVEEVEKKYKPATEIQIFSLIDISDDALMTDMFRQLERSPKQSDILLAFMQLRGDGDKVSRADLLKMSGASASALDGLIRKGILEKKEVEIQRIDTYTYHESSAPLTAAQDKAFKEINQAFSQKDVALLYGVTGSGKTHIYIKLIEEQLAAGKQVLYMVPDQALSAQLISRISGHFGEDVVLYHNKFTPAEKVELWNNVTHGKHKLILSGRAGVFLPYQHLGLIIIDEEHDPGFKQTDPAPRYHARESAIVLAALASGCNVLLGTATPSFESYHNAETGKYALVELTEPFYQSGEISYQLVDRRENKPNVDSGSFSTTLLGEVQLNLRSKEQTLIFQNRRGYSPQLQCSSCGWIPYCVNCDISLTYYQKRGQLSCHYCGYKQIIPSTCRQCGHNALQTIGTGTERAEEELKLQFPGANILRLDPDSLNSKSKLFNAFSSLDQGKADIIVGTQLLVRGLDFQGITLIGMLNADGTLHSSDFRAEERTYQLISQLAGRAGRRGQNARILLQTYNPEHPVFGYVRERDFTGLYNEFIHNRNDFHFPPFTRLVKLSVRHEKEDIAELAAHELADKLRAHFGPRLLGPEPTPIPRMRNKYHFNLLLKLPRLNKQLKEAKAQILNEVGSTLSGKKPKNYRAVQIVIDVDPIY